MTTATATQAASAWKNFRVEVADGVATLWLDEPGESVNVVEPGFACATRASTSWALATSVPATAITRSPGRRPASWAGLPT